MPMFTHQYSTYNGYIIEVASEHSNNEVSSSDSAKFVFQFRVHRFVEFIVKPAVNSEPFKVEERYGGTIDKTLEIELSTSHHHQQKLFSEQEVIVILRKVGLSRYTKYLAKQISYTAKKVCSKRCEKMGLKIEVWDRITYVHDEQETVERVMLESGEEYVSVPASEEAIERLERIEFRLDNDYDCSDCMVCFEEMEIGFEVIQMPCKHIFHGHCISLWLQRNHVCPLCRFEIEF